jgi:hypothetical protein
MSLNKLGKDGTTKKQKKLQVGAKKDYLNDIYLGEYVEITTEQVLTYSNQTEEESTHTSVPFTVEGIFLDSDDKFIHLSTTTDGVDLSVNKSKIETIRIKKEELTVEEQMLDNLEIPEKGKAN